MDIFTYNDFRIFLNEFFEDKKKNNPGFSYTQISKITGIKSRSYMHMVMSGKRKLSARMIPNIIKLLGLKKKEASYFEALVFYNQAKNIDEKKYYLARLLELKPKDKYYQLEKDTLEYFSNKYLVIIREMVKLPHFQENNKWISQILNNAISPLQIREAIATLIRLGLLERDEKGKLKQTKGTIQTAPKLESLDLCNYHSTVLSGARDAILKVPYDLREMTSLTITMDHGIISEVKDIINKCNTDIINLMNKRYNKRDDVFQVNIQLFPVTHTKTKKK